MKAQMSFSGFVTIDRLYQILKRTILSVILCHGLVLDVGCGEGSFPKKEKIVGLDVNKQQIKRCSYDFKVLGDACALPFKDKVFDVALEMGCLPYTKNRKYALGEMLRVGRRVYLIEPIRRHRREHWFSLPELSSLGIPLLFIFRTVVIIVKA
jgi:ubiquinone/menaquinone biosynthesis C-methylase UbiE